MGTPILDIRNLTKSYGSLIAIHDFSLTVNKGEVCGILGPNGSGKTTTLGILLDILKADRGDFLWFGEEPTNLQRKRVGALLEVPVFYPYLSAVQNLQIIADIKNCSYDYIDGVLETVGLSQRKKHKFKTYSLGMKQRLAIAAALLGKPEVLILDEPTNGLDPQGIAEIRELIIKIGEEGTTVILASHLLDEVQKVCTHVVILEKGKKLGEGSVKEVLSATSAFELAADDLDLLRIQIEQHEAVSEVQVEKGLLIAVLSREVPANEMNKYLSDKGIYLTHLSQRKRSLEKYFLELLSDNNA